MYYVVLGCTWSYLVEVLEALVNLNVERIKGRFAEVVGAITTPPTFKTHLVGISGLDRNPPGVYQVFVRPECTKSHFILKTSIYRIYSLYILPTRWWWWRKREELKMADLLLQFRGKGVKMGGGRGLSFDHLLSQFTLISAQGQNPLLRIYILQRRGEYWHRVTQNLLKWLHSKYDVYRCPTVWLCSEYSLTQI